MQPFNILRLSLLIFLSLLFLPHVCLSKAADRFDPSVDMRIAIIGAGASGLTAADTLKRKGYKHISVFEKRDRVGGKVHSVIEDDSIYEVGAFWAGSDYHTVDALAKAYDVSIIDESLVFKVKLEDGREYGLVEYLTKTTGPIELAATYGNWKRVLQGFSYLKSADGFFKPLHPDLSLPFDKFAVKYGITAFAKAFRPFWIGCGYGYYDKTPALYVLKLMLGALDVSILQFLESILPMDPNPSFGLRRVEGGFQSLWEKIAANLDDLRLNAKVVSLNRYLENGEDRIEIVTEDGQKEVFDAVIISSDLNQSLGFIDASRDELELFSQIETYRYLIHVFEADGLNRTHDRMVFFDSNGSFDKVGHLTAMANRSGSQPIHSNRWISGQLLEEQMSLELAERLLVSDVEVLGGSVSSIKARYEWSYFPHVSSTALSEGFYSKMQSLQGQKASFYVGGVLGFETVEGTASYAKHLIETWF